GILLDYLALGLDPEKATLFLQSSVPEVTELTFLLSNYTPMGLLERAHAYKDAISRGKNINHGLFTYPVLMAADILAYHANIVPVGKDQKQHIEITRDIALRFNNRYGEVLTIPEPFIEKDMAVIPGMDGRKMSKSYGNTIEIFNSPGRMKKQIMNIVTDSTPMEEPLDADSCNVFALYRFFATPEECEEMKEKYASPSFGYGHAKLALFEKIDAYFAPFREKREALARDEEMVREILRLGGEKARQEAQKTVSDVRKAVGIIEI
ncbi:MAG TPA: tryptophan--tRNA ligase, partial [Candidatus Aminicenantes bacterium]|nr:tryptophan--tRNA ligase [Candidatus Aminicenantes bacterium]